MERKMRSSPLERRQKNEQSSFLNAAPLTSFIFLFIFISIMGAGASTRANHAKRATRLEELQAAETAAMATLASIRQELHSERHYLERLEATRWYRERRPLASSELLSGWHSPRMKLLKGRPGVDDAYLCPSGVGKWTRKPGDTTYQYTF